MRIFLCKNPPELKKAFRFRRNFHLLFLQKASAHDIPGALQAVAEAQQWRKSLRFQLNIYKRRNNFLLGFLVFRASLRDCIGEPLWEAENLHNVWEKFVEFRAICVDELVSNARSIWLLFKLTFAARRHDAKFIINSALNSKPFFLIQPQPSETKLLSINDKLALKISCSNYYRASFESQSEAFGGGYWRQERFTGGIIYGMTTCCRII